MNDFKTEKMMRGLTELEILTTLRTQPSLRSSFTRLEERYLLKDVGNRPCRILDYGCYRTLPVRYE